jgi:copper chaperone
VQGMGCKSCANTIETQVGALSGVTSVKVDLDKEEVAVEMEQANILNQVKETIEEYGYGVVQ